MPVPALLLCAALAAAPEPGPSLEVPVLEMPANLPDRTWPGMQQALRLSTGFYLVAHWGAAWLGLPGRTGASRGLGGRLLGLGTTLLFDLFATWLPGGASWTHEEFHRAVLSRRGIGSRNGVWDLRLFAGSIPVYGMADTALAALKRDHPAEFVRMASAGMEGEVELVRALERHALFEDARGEHFALSWLSLGSAWAYLFSGSQAGTDEQIRGWMTGDGGETTRDFDGHDFTSWARDLFRPDEPYSARGVHPSGEGVHRYVLVSQLTSEERRYLELQAGLFLLNALDPMLLGFKGFSGSLGGRPVLFTAAVRHRLTPFGFVVEGDALLRSDPLRLALTLRVYVNDVRPTPGLEAEVIRFPVRPGVEVGARLALWLQPEDQRFRATRSVPGGLAALRLDAQVLGPAGFFAEVEGKTAGWHPGRTRLDGGVTLLAGATLRP